MDSDEQGEDRDLADQGVHLGADLLQLGKVHLTANLHPCTLSCPWNQVAVPRRHLSAVFGGTSAGSGPVAVPSVACLAQPVNGAVVVVPARGGGRVVAPDPGGGLGGGRVLGGDGGGEQDRLEHSSLLAPVLAVLHVLRLALLRVPLAHLLKSATMRL